MLRFSGSSQNPGSSVLDELQLSNGLLWKAGEETITIIHPAGDKGMNKFLQVLTGNKTSNSCNVFEMIVCWFMALFHCMVRHGTVRYGSLLGGFPLGTVPGTWYFFSTTSVEVPCKPYRYQNVTCKLCWSLIGLRKSSLLRHWTCDTRPSSTVLPARFKSAQPAKDRTQLLFKQTHIFASTTK